MKSLFFNQTGSTLITGMIAALSVGIISALIMQQSQVTEKQTRAPRVKSAMIQVETKVRSLAFEPSAYGPCPPGSPAGCEVVINANSFLNLRQEIPGARCSGGGFCGVDVLTPVFNPATGAFAADVIYTGQEVSLAPIRVTASVPTAVWKSDGVAGCSETSPIFMGVDGAGNPVCGNLPADCGAGRYLRGVDLMRLTTASAVSCEELPSAASCPAGQYIAAVNWNASTGAVQVGCLPQKSPFQVASLGGDPTTYSYLGDPTYTVPPYPVTTTTVPNSCPASTNCPAGQYRVRLLGFFGCTISGGMCTNCTFFDDLSSCHSLADLSSNAPGQLKEFKGACGSQSPSDMGTGTCNEYNFCINDSAWSSSDPNCAFTPPTVPTTTTVPSMTFYILVNSSSYGVVGTAAGFCHDPKGPNYETMTLHASTSESSVVFDPSTYTVAFTCTEPGGTPSPCSGTAYDINIINYTATVRRISDNAIVFTESGEAEFNCQ